MPEASKQFDASKAVTDLPEVNTGALAELGAGADDSAGYTLDELPPRPEDDPAPDAATFRFVSGRHPVECRGDGRFYHVTTGAEVLDALGRAFDPASHNFDPTVEPIRPILTRAGLLQRRSGQAGQFPRSAPATALAPVVVLPQRDPDPAPGPEPPGPTPATPFASEGAARPVDVELLGEIGSDANDAAAEAFAAVLVASLDGAAVAIAGEWAEQTGSESEAQRVAWCAYLKTLDMSAPPAWSIPLLATLPWATRVARDERSPWNKRRRQRAPLQARQPQPDEPTADESAPTGPDVPSQFPPDFDRSSLDS
jgi:hypothetical protein